MRSSVPGKILRTCLAATLASTLSLALGQVSNGGFESPTLNPNSWVDTPNNVPGWTFFGRSGLANGSTPLASGAYTGAQYAFLATQGANSGRMSQTISGMTPGVQYRLRFWLRTRPGFPPVDLGVRMDGVSLMREVRSFGIWIEFATDWFTPANTSAAFEFYAIPIDADRLTVVDHVRLEQGPPPPLGLPLNGGFELPAYPQGSWDFQPGGIETAWKFYAASGIEHGPSSWGSGAFEGVQYAFMQKTAYFNQLVGDFLPNRTYHVEWYMARRNGHVGGNNGNAIRVLLDQQEIFPFTLWDDPNWKNFASRPFYPGGSSGLLQFEGADSPYDQSELIDFVRIFENVDLSPESVQVAVGVPVSGNLASLFESDDNRLAVAPAQNVDRVSAPVQIVVDATAPSSIITYLALSFETSASVTDLVERMELYNFETLQWVPVSIRNPSNVDTKVHVIRSENASAFVSQLSRTVRCRFWVGPSSPFGSRNWQYRIDQVSFAVTPF